MSETPEEHVLDEAPVAEAVPSEPVKTVEVDPDHILDLGVYGA